MQTGVRINWGYVRIEKGSQCSKSWYAIQLDVLVYMGSWDLCKVLIYKHENNLKAFHLIYIIWLGL